MGKVMSLVTRPMKNYNIESRAHKIISKEKPKPAPRYEASIKEAEELLKENPESFNELMKKNTVLDDHLKDVYVKSYDPQEIVVSKIAEENPKRPLPLNRRMSTVPEFGFVEPAIVPPGRCTLKQVVTLLSKHQADPKSWDTIKEALDSRILEKDLENIIHYFRIYHVYVPDDQSKIAYGTPKITQHKLESGKNV